jgi:hypothetical protein
MSVGKEAQSWRFTALLGGNILRYRSLLSPAAGLLASIFTAAALTQSSQTGAPVVPTLPEEVKPIRVAGLGIRVSDLERSKTFY